MVTDSNIRSLFLIKMDNTPPSIIRQPPPPPPLKPAARKEGNTNPEMVGGNLRSCKRKMLTDIESLPDEVLFEVLVRLQAQDIYDSARLVCRKWYHMIHTNTFINAHLHRSTYGLLFQSMNNDPFLISVGESGRVEISEENRYNKLSIPVQTSCNGLLLESQIWKNKNIYVCNPATRQYFTLPKLVGNTLVYERFAIAYAAASMEYKAVVLFFPGRGVEKRMCFILTIGVDSSWRTIVKESVSLAGTGMFASRPLITEGFVHFYHISSNEVLTLNVETEIITETSGPTPKIDRPNTYLSTGRYSSLLRPCGEFCWEVWEMKPKIDYQWRKVWDISLEAHKCTTFQRFDFDEYSYLIPIGWLKYLEVLVFRTTLRSEIFVYNFLKHEIVTMKLPVPNCDYDPIVHKDSLVSLRGC
ncbi:hypothetical protein CASFOL_026492 [Castilleja foliolosa]|uniref:F-box domain-containing protein n=1 Tax=Castilleja foliolosa TaxID=1961234 RepID=A0ABD3CHA2_9LAMI